ncbi:steroid receptor RNA activator 1 isoform X1 [Erpetoichthys calabaricus]|uniref:steroid receptor RNA activator 1 isoform X1 n=1 Tax=Erpetoichthys calabaricus TaxID=27687 RepID=UPI002234DE28|nr:steroid receptor RNA activator 1 isoform X1 [Erpetoichthys calabaricus]
MADLYVKPGNHERGWNDPPQFSYGLQAQAQGAPKRNLLNKRVPPPQMNGPQSNTGTVDYCIPAKRTPSAPPTMPLAPPPCAFVSPQQKRSEEDNSTVITSSDSEPDIHVDTVMLVLNWALAVCQSTVKKQVCDDISKRLNLFVDMWNSGKLSLPVKKRMNILAQEIKKQNWNAADEIHRSLIVDHINEVSQWMVGVKRLIAESRSLPAEVFTVETSED